MALYLIGYNRDGCYVTPEPLGPGGDPYPAMNGKPDPESLDRLVRQTAMYFREREEAVRALVDAAACCVIRPAAARFSVLRTWAAAYTGVMPPGAASSSSSPLPDPNKLSMRACSRPAS